MLEHIYKESTYGIEIEVIPIFIPEQTQFVNQYLYTYNISITNNSDNVCQLLSRHWIITDGHGKKEEVKGMGVVGNQPVIQPGETYQYSSFCPISTPTGNMRGAFEFVSNNRPSFWVKVPLFFLRQDALIQ